MYSLIREAPRLTSLVLKGVEFPGTRPGDIPSGFAALAGASIRHLELHVTRFYDDARGGSEHALTSVLASLPQLRSLDMSFARCGHGAEPQKLPGAESTLAQTQTRSHGACSHSCTEGITLRRALVR